MHSLLVINLLSIVLIIFLSINPAYAHRLNIFIDKKGHHIKIMSYYSGGAKCKDCKVEIYCGKKKIKEGITDEDGQFLFIHECPIKSKVVVSDRLGHRAEYEIK